MVGNVNRAVDELDRDLDVLSDSAFVIPALIRNETVQTSASAPTLKLGSFPWSEALLQGPEASRPTRTDQSCPQDS